MAPKEFQNVKTGSKHGHQNQDLFDEFLGSFWDQFYLGPVFFSRVVQIVSRFIFGWGGQRDLRILFRKTFRRCQGGSGVSIASHAGSAPAAVGL